MHLDIHLITRVSWSKCHVSVQGAYIQTSLKYVLKIYFCFIYVYVCLCVCACPLFTDAYRGQKRLLDILELELEAVVSY